MAKRKFSFLSKVINRLLFSTFTLLIFSSAFAQPNGEALFKANCTQCHAVHSQVIGPALVDIDKRRDEAWLIKWIKNSQAVIKSGDAYGADIFKKYNNTVMPNQNLSDDEIKAVLAYVKTVKPPAAKPGAPVAGAPEGEPEGTSPWLVILIIAVLWIIAAALRKSQKGLERALREKEGVPHPAEYHGWKGVWMWMKGNKKLVAIILILGFTYGTVKGWYWLKDVGVTTNYEPDQPIKFSHKLHAGDNKINCIYCHSGAEKSRHANIPSANVCLNCHKYIKEGPKYGEDEIKKIYTALDWDGTNMGANQKPIQWVRVHSLPDFAYFNHSQHVVVGKLQCQQCHGPIEEMEVVKQFSPLTMGWCIDCHRSTEVKMDGNDYYTKLHEDLKKKYGAEAKLTVDKIGGLECARCHY